MSETAGKKALDTARALIDRKLKDDGYVIAALEGGAATGKTTLAAELAEMYQAPVIAMDDFFLPPAMRTPGRFALPGGNIDSERFDAQVAEPLRKRRAFAYPVYDCHADRMNGEKHVPVCPVILVEGVYSLHPLYRDVYNLRLFLRASPETRDARLRTRGDWLYRRFQEVWLPLEDAYFASEDWKTICDAMIDT